MKFRTAVGALAATLAASASAEQIYGVTSDGFLVTFDSATPDVVNAGVAIMGLQANESVLGIDIRPATGEMFALGSFNRLYTIDPTTGQATQVGDPFDNPLNGSTFGFDFNPTIDRIRVVSDADQNLVLNPNDGGDTLVTSLFYDAGDPNFGVDPNVVGSAYTNSFAGATTTQLYDIDTGLDILVTQANSAGTLGTVGPLGVDVTDVVGFDISGASGIAYLVVQNVTLSRSTLWTVDLTSGTATSLGEIGGGSFLTAMTVVPAPGALGVLGIGALAGLRRRRH